MNSPSNLAPLLERIAAALERARPRQSGFCEFDRANGYVWEPCRNRFAAIARINSIGLEQLVGIDRQKEILLANSLQFARGYAANNALLWGTRGMGKSSLIKAVHREIVNRGLELKIVEIHREDIASLPECLKLVRQSRYRIILYCDDLSFEKSDSTYKSLKAVLEGGLEGRPENALFYATSNRRHLMPRDMIENERSTAINPAETAEEKISLSDRFGLWIGFHNCTQQDYLEMVLGYAGFFGLKADPDTLRAEALEWATTRGGRSGRVAWQFIQDLAGRQKKSLSPDAG